MSRCGAKLKIREKGPPEKNSQKVLRSQNKPRGHLALKKPVRFHYILKVFGATVVEI